MTSAPVYTAPPQQWDPSPKGNPTAVMTAETATRRKQPSSSAAQAATAPSDAPDKSILEMPRLRKLRSLLALAAQVENSDLGFRTGFNDPYRIELQQMLSQDSLPFLPALSTYLEETSPGIRAVTLLYVAEIPHDDPALHRLKFVLPFLRDPDPDVRDAAATALLDLNTPFAVPYLRTALESENSFSVRQTMQQGLALLQPLLHTT